MAGSFVRPPPDHSGVCLQRGRLILTERLGVGSSSTVWLAVDRRSCLHAVKVLFPSTHKRSVLGPEDTKEWGRGQERMFKREAKIHALVHDHPNIPTLHHFFIERGLRCFLLDCCNGGSLAVVLRTPFFWKRDDRIKSVLAQLIDALQHCHNRGVAHRDINPENVLFSRDHQRVYLTDFGLASKGNYSVDFKVGSKSHMSPECFGNEFLVEAYNPQISDIWSLGILFLQILVGYTPWYAPSEDEDPRYAFYLQYRAALFYDALPITHGAAALLSCILEPDSGQRIALDEFRRELEDAGPLTVTEDDLAYASKVARNSYRTRVSWLGVPYRVPPRHADLFEPPSYSQHPPALTRPPSYADLAAPSSPSPNSSTELASSFSSSTHSSHSIPALPRSSSYISTTNPISHTSFYLSNAFPPEPSKHTFRLMSIRRRLTGTTR